MGIALLGPLEVDGQPGLSHRDRVVLEALAIHDRAVTPVDVLADALWGDRPPASWSKVVHGSVWRLRRTLGRSAIRTTTAGYRLELGDDEIDLRRFQRLVARGRALAAAGEHARAAAVLEEALSLWRGSALPDLEHWPTGRHEAERLEELRCTVREEHLAALLDSGHDVVPAASALVSADPVREARWSLLASALYRSGRQTEALAALRRARATLRDELGLDPGDELLALEQSILKHDPGLRGPGSPAGPDRSQCPYKGLLVYDRDDAELFFGRSDEIELCLTEVRRAGLLVIAGPSGSGKSSLVRAGVVPALVAAGRRVVVTTPGTDPRSSLTVAAASGQQFVLVVDQLEELFTAGHPDDVVRNVLDGLEASVRNGQECVLVVRADQLGAFASSAGMSRRVERALHLLGAMTQDDLRSAIESPAAYAGLTLEHGLVELMIHEVEGEPGALPLLSHALAETWERREGRTLTVDGYRATGGISAAVAQSAEALYESLPPGRRATLRAVMMRLVALSTAGDPVVSRQPLVSLEVDGEHLAMLELLRRARLVTTDRATATVAHESVVRAWPRLRTWLDADAASQGRLRHLSQAAQDWETRGRPDSELYRGSRLESALEWRRVDRPPLTLAEREFLDRAQAMRDAERDNAAARLRQQARQSRRLRIALAGTAAGLVLALVAGALAVQQSQEASGAARVADVERLVAQSVALRATRRDVAALLAVEAYRLLPDARTRGALLGVFTGSPGFLGYRRIPEPLTSGQVLPDGRSLLGVGKGGTVRLLDVQSGRATGRFPRPGRGVTNARVAVSADASTAATISWAGPDRGGGRAYLTVYDVESRERRFPDTLLPLDPGSVAVGPDGRYVAVSGYADGIVLIYDTTVSPAALATVENSAPGVHVLPTVGSASARFESVRRTAALQFTAAGALLVGSEVDVVRLVDPASGTVLRRLTGGPGLSSNNQLALAPDGSVLVTAGTEAVTGWDLGTGRLLWAQQISEDGCLSLVVTSAGAALCGGRFGRVVALDMRTGGETGATYDMQRGPVSDLALSPDGRTLVQLSSTESVLARWRFDGTGPLARLLPFRGSPLSYNADGSLLLTADTQSGADPEARPPVSAVLDARTGVVVSRLPAEMVFPVWTANPSRLVTWDDGTAFVTDVRSHQRLVRLNGGFGEPPTGATLSGDGRRLLAWAHPDSPVTVVWEIWDLASGQPVAAQLVDRLGTAALSRDGRLVVFVGDETMSTHLTGSRKTLATRPGIVRAATAADGTVAASAVDGSLTFHDPRTLRALGAPLRRTPAQVQLAFSADGSLLVAHGGDSGVRLVDVPARIPLGEAFDLGTEHSRPVALRPDGRELALPHPDGILLWDLRTATAVREACRLAGHDLSRTEARTFLGDATRAGAVCA